jgi:adenine-specific DNA-methyltransferase
METEQDLIQPAEVGTGDSRYLQEQLITYLGNKRALLPFIGHAVEKVSRSLGGEKLSFLDMFSGTGIVSRFMKRYASLVIANDLESYSRVTNDCYLSNVSDVDMSKLEEAMCYVKERIARERRSGFILELYAPGNETTIERGERAFYTRRNAAYLDAARVAIGELPEKIQKYLLAPLIAEASVHVNTSGVFKGFYKNADGVGQFGGHARNALQRILGDIELMLPVFSRYECDYAVHQADANALAPKLAQVDLAYFDPPYNQHPYGSNYFLLNLLVDYKRPERISRVSGIPTNWNRSQYNRRRAAADTLFGLIGVTNAKYCLISYNSEGFIGQDEFLCRLNEMGEVEVCETPYNTFRGSRNLHERPLFVTEFLYLLKK